MSFKVLMVLVGVLGHLAIGLPPSRPWQPPAPAALTTESRIVGGTNAPDGYALHMVGLRLGDAPWEALLCGGSIVTEWHVVTAAHCIDIVITWDGGLMPSLRGVVGSNRWTSRTDVVKFSHHINHPDWNPWEVKNDLGFLILTHELQFNDRVQPVAIDFNWVGEGEEALVTGWGRLGLYPNPVPEYLQKLYVYTISHESCVAGVHLASLIWGPVPDVDRELEICTFHSVAHGMCNGDSGSGLISSKTRKMIGMVSWGFACALGFPDVFVRMSGAESFMKLVLGDHLLS